MLAGMGVQQELKRNFSLFSMLGLAFAILNSWTALGASMSLALPSGGPDAVIWGLVVAGLCNLCLAASLAEFLSAYVATMTYDDNADTGPGIPRPADSITGSLSSAGNVGFQSYLGSRDGSIPPAGLH